MVLADRFVLVGWLLDRIVTDRITVGLAGMLDLAGGLGWRWCFH